MKKWNANELLELGRDYQGAAVLAAAAELEIFDTLASGPRTAKEIARKIRGNLRATIVLLDALAALGLLDKGSEQYSLPAESVRLLTQPSSESILGMCQHQANCLRRWAQLAAVVRQGAAAKKIPSVRGEKSDHASFIEAMHNISRPAAAETIRAVQPLTFRHLLDVGGASGTWTMAFLWACPGTTATLFDLPPVIALATKRLTEAGFDRRVKLVAGDYLADPLPGGADLAWVSAIVHQNSRTQNRRLFANVFQALEPGGRIAIRDLVMEPSRTRPATGALFAINMLVATDGGGTFTFDEIQEDLQKAGFAEVTLARQDGTMNSVIVARRPAIAGEPSCAAQAPRKRRPARR